MTHASPPQTERSYGCTYGCGNPFDVIVTMVADATTELVCLPCFVQMAASAVRAMTEAGDPTVLAAMEYAAANPGEQVPGPTALPGRRNAPATNTDPGIFEQYSDVTTIDELPEEFRQ